MAVAETAGIEPSPRSFPKKTLEDLEVSDFRSLESSKGYFQPASMFGEHVGLAWLYRFVLTQGRRSIWLEMRPVRLAMLSCTRQACFLQTVHRKFVFEPRDEPHECFTEVFVLANATVETMKRHAFARAIGLWQLSLSITRRLQMNHLNEAPELS